MSTIRHALQACVPLALVAALTVVSATAAENTIDLGSPIAPFTLPDIHGRDRSSQEFAEKPILVVAFLGAECPLARLYAPRLQELCNQYSDKGVAFVAIDANDQDSLTEVANFVRKSEIKFPVLKDRDQKVADGFGVTRNPQVFVLDKDRKIRYFGRIDDQYGQGSSSGYAKTKVKTRDLGNAIDELLAGKEVSEPRTQVAGCIIGRKAKSDPKGEVTYTKHIAGLLQNRCVACHRPGQIGPFSLTDYDEVAAWGEMMKEVVSDGRMPPWSANPQYGHFSNDARLSDAEKKLLFTWVDNGCPQGDPADLPAPRKWVEGWAMGEPDQIVYMEKPYKVQAEGTVPYQNFTVDPGWTEDKWIQSAEVRPGNRAVVHHIIASAVFPESSAGADDGDGDGGDSQPAAGRGRRGLGDGRGAGLTNYVPGGTATMYKPGVAQFVKAGSKIRFQMHYTPNGAEQDDRSYIGFIFADPKTVKKRVYGGVAGNNAFIIPPQTDDYKVESETIVRNDQLMLWMMPHMHVRGKSFRYEAIYPDGKSEILLDVPRYDFNWQITYELAEPKLLPKGTKLHCTAYYDNSENNPSNPDPSDTVRFGPQTWHEMMFGWYWTLPVEDDAHLAAAPAKQAE